MYRVESEFSRRGGVHQRIVNKDALLGAAPRLLQHEIEYLAVRLDQPDLPGNYDGIEPVEELEAFARVREGFSRPVAERVNFVRGLLQLGQNLDRLIDRA